MIFATMQSNEHRIKVFVCLCVLSVRIDNYPLD